MQNEKSSNDQSKNGDKTNYNSWELSGEESPLETTKTGQKQGSIVKTPPAEKKPSNKNSAAKAVSHARSAVANTNPNVRTGLSDQLTDTGTNVAYTERED